MTMSARITEIITRRLKRMGLNKKDFAILAGVSPPVVTNWLSGNHNFTVDTLERIENILRISFFDINIGEKIIPCSPCILKNITPV